MLSAAIFVAGALVVRQIPTLRDYTETVLAHARQGSKPLLLLITVLNGVAEEIFFRGALFVAIGRRYPVPISTAVYALATLNTGNPMLVFAAATLGVVLGLQRRASGGVLAPILTHVTWSTIMLFAMPTIRVEHLMAIIAETHCLDLNHAAAWPRPASPASRPTR